MAALGAAGQQIQAAEPQASGSTASLRGLSVVSGHIAWASGTGGSWLRTTDGGAHWQAGTVAGAGHLDFRDIKAFGPDVAYLMAAGAARGIFKTSDGARHWRLQYQNPDPHFFLDSLAFWDARHGLALGDPIDGKFLILRTEDGGEHWMPATGTPPALAGEGGFAASGSALMVLPGTKTAWFATGGPGGARVFRTQDGGRNWTVTAVPMGGSASSGIFSLAFLNRRIGIALGGDYAHPGDSGATAALTTDGGRSWRLAPAPAALGYRSAVAYAPHSRGKVVVAVGTGGTVISRDGGQHWAAPGAPALAQSLNAVAITSNGAGWAVGPRGRIVHFQVH
ncbi:MAG: WD40/YVTN/BNR-like repeat-containing protein [Terriglobales bacterium]